MTVSPARFTTYGKKYKIDAENWAQLDHELGIIKPGSVVKKGDVLATVVTRREVDPEDRMLRLLSKSLVKPYRVEPIVWERDNPGIVTEAKQVGRKINIFVKSQEPMRVGDKICLAEDHEVLTQNDGWKPISEVTEKDSVYTLNPETENIEIQRPTRVLNYKHRGRMYQIETQQVSQVVTENHRLYVARRVGRSEEWKWALHEAREIFGKKYKMKRDGLWCGQEVEWFDVPSPSKLSNRSKAQVERYSRPMRFKMDDWLEFLGYYHFPLKCSSAVPITFIFPAYPKNRASQYNSTSEIRT